jgi:hypothetical protein
MRPQQSAQYRLGIPLDGDLSGELPLMGLLT